MEAYTKLTGMSSKNFFLSKRTQVPVKMLFLQLSAEWALCHDQDSQVLLLCTDGGADLDRPISLLSSLSGRARPSGLNYFCVERGREAPTSYVLHAFKFRLLQAVLPGGPACALSLLHL